MLAETRLNWQSSCIRLLDQIEAPTLLFYFSKREVHYRERWFSVNALLGDFPQLVTTAMLDNVRPHADHSVECVSRRGSPQPLTDRFSGQPATIDLSDDRPDFHGVWRRNPYYPSPEMHEDAAEALEPACRSIIAEQTAK